jgi:hypothetical protein
MQYPVSTANVFNGAKAETVAERRAQIEQTELLLRTERELQLRAQRSSLSTARERIQLWEKLHRLHLPRNANHKLLDLIARQTDLSLADVQHEQIRRNARTAV